MPLLRSGRYLLLVGGLTAAALAVGLAFAIHALLPAVPVLTAAVALGILVAQFRVIRLWLDGVLKPGLRFSARTLMRAGIVLLGLKLSLIDIGHLGALAILAIVGIVLATFAGTYWMGRLFRLPSVHDVGQVVATAQTAGSAALAIAVVVKLTRVLMLAPMVAGAGLVLRRRDRLGGVAVDDRASRPPIVPLFVGGFLVAVLLRSFLVLPEPVLEGADVVQTILLAAALFGLGTAVRCARSCARAAGRSRSGCCPGC